MRILVLITFLASISFAQSNLDEFELHQKLAVFGQQENWKELKKTAYQLLESFKNSIQRETYYNVIALSISNECWGNRKKNKQPPDTTELRGTITLSISEILTEESKEKYNELINVVNSYFVEFPEGQFEDSFYTFLITAYALPGYHNKVIELCENLYNSNKPNLKLKAAFQLARYAHFNKDYLNALRYYDFILENIGKSDHHILYNYLIANCYFELNSRPNTYKYLDTVFELTKNDSGNDIRKMAGIMKAYLDDKNNKFNRKFVVFKDPANLKN